jgi:hypothetical protein
MCRSNVRILLLLGAETVVDIWLYSGIDSSIPGNENEVASNEGGVSGDNNDTLEQLAGVTKMDDSVNEGVTTKESVSAGSSDSSEQAAHVAKVSNVSREVCNSPAKEMLPGLIKPKIEPVDDSECTASCDDNSHLDASCHGGHSFSDMQFSSLDHDYFGVMNVGIKKESEDLCISEHNIQDCSQENAAEECSDLCDVESSAETDSSVENHVMKVLPVVQENKTTNSIVHAVEVPSKSVTVNNHLERNVSSAENNSKLTTLVKCMDKSGHVFYLTLGQTHLKPQAKLVSVVPTSEQPVNVANSTSLLNKQQAPHTQPHNKLVPTTVMTSGLKLKFPLGKPVLSNYNCKEEEDSVISQGNSCLLVPPQGTAGNVITIQSNAHNALSVETNSSSLLTSQQTSKMIPLQGINVKPGVKVTSPVVSTSNSSELLKQLQNNSGQLLSFLKLNATVPVANKSEEANKVGDLKASAQSASTPVQDQSFLIVKNGQLYLIKHVQNSAALSVLAAKSGAKKCESISKQQSVLLTDKSLLSSPVRSVKGSFSLLKKQANAQVPQNISHAAVKPLDVDKSESARLLMSARTLVLNKGDSRHITHSNKICYGEALR